MATRARREHTSTRAPAQVLPVQESPFRRPIGDVLVVQGGDGQGLMLDPGEAIRIGGRAGGNAYSRTGSGRGSHLRCSLRHQSWRREEATGSRSNRAAKADRPRRAEYPGSDTFITIRCSDATRAATPPRHQSMEHAATFRARSTMQSTSGPPVGGGTICRSAHLKSASAVVIGTGTEPLEQSVSHHGKSNVLVCPKSRGPGRRRG